MIPWMMLWRYWQARRLRFDNRAALEQYQRKKLQAFTHRVLSRSPWFSKWLDQPLSQWPTMNKPLMMTHFDEMNTAGLKREALLDVARRSEQSRDFTPELNGFSVGLSSGTSGQRGLFVVSPREQQIWAGGMLAKMLPDGLFAGERVALFLRADNNLYHSVNNRWLSLSFYDLFAPFEQQLLQLEAWKPTIIVAPAQVLRALAITVREKRVSLPVKKVISVAEVLEPQDKALLTQVFEEVGEVYQATEGFLAATCEHGTLHLNEEFIYIEPQWIDECRFTPLITDFTRETQPIVRYHLDDVLVKRMEACPCGRATMALSHIEGRSDDSLSLPNREGSWTTVFADLCSRVLANTLPLTADYRLVQRDSVTLHLMSDCTPEMLVACRENLERVFITQGIAVDKLRWQLVAHAIPAEFTAKRRRILRNRDAQWTDSNTA